METAITAKYYLYKTLCSALKYKEIDPNFKKLQHKMCSEFNASRVL